MRTRDDALLRQIDDYNREDCIATHELRDWLLERRDEVIETYGPLPPHPSRSRRSRLHPRRRSAPRSASGCSRPATS